MFSVSCEISVSINWKVLLCAVTILILILFVYILTAAPHAEVVRLAPIIIEACKIVIE